MPSDPDPVPSRGPLSDSGASSHVIYDAARLGLDAIESWQNFYHDLWLATQPDMSAGEMWDEIDRSRRLLVSSLGELERLYRDASVRLDGWWLAASPPEFDRKSSSVLEGVYRIGVRSLTYFRAAMPGGCFIDPQGHDSHVEPEDEFDYAQPFHDAAVLTACEFSVRHTHVTHDTDEVKAALRCEAGRMIERVGRVGLVPVTGFDYERLAGIYAEFVPTTFPRPPRPSVVHSIAIAEESDAIGRLPAGWDRMSTERRLAAVRQGEPGEFERRHGMRRYRPAVPFAPSAAQTAILEALDGKALSQHDLEQATGIGRGLLHKNDGRGLKELKAQGLVAHSRELGGYYRPDAPPAGILPNPESPTGSD